MQITDTMLEFAGFRETADHAAQQGHVGSNKPRDGST
jgi:hypothetical protein